MSHVMNPDPPLNEEQEEIDALNDETFGCDLADINDDWEDQHDKLLPSFMSTSGVQSSGTTDNSKIAQKASSNSVDIESFLNFANISGKRMTNIEDVFPRCEDIVKQSISNFILEDDNYDNEDDIYPDFASYELDMQNEPVGSKQNSKLDKKTINLESLKPPSPSILPFDDPFMSSVWRPLSPELVNQHSADDSQDDFSLSTANESKIYTLEELEKNLTLNGHDDSISIKSSSLISKTKVMRLEDLEAQMLEDKPNKNEPTFSSKANNIATSTSTDITTNVHNPQMPAFMSGKMPSNIMEIAAMSLAKLALQPPSIIPQQSKILPPPPGLGSKFNLTGTSSVDTKSSVQTNQAYISKLQQAQHGQDAFHSQMAMANAMANALANLSQLPSVQRPPMPHLSMMNSDLKMPSSASPLVLDPLVQQEQQRIINRIITPAQAQRFYPSQMNNFLNTRNQDRFAGFMTQREKDWLVKIFRLQCKVNDPYVEDYYEVNFKVKKATLERRQNLAKQYNKNVDDVEIDSMIESEPLIVLPELAKVEEDKPKYIQFDNTLGKIQVLNTKCPRKLLDVNPDKHSLLKIDPHTSNLMKIERLYEHLLNIEDEDKRMPILPENIIHIHRERRVYFCEKLFRGLVKPIDSTNKDEGTQFTLIQRSMPTLKKIDLEVDKDLLNISKGLILVYRSLFQLRNENQLVVLICSLLKGPNYQKFIIQAEKAAKTSYGNMLIKTLGRIQQTRNLIYIAASLDDLDLINNHKYGRLFLVTIFKQYQASTDKLLFVYFWKLFVQTLIEHLSSNPELRQLCIDHYQYLAQL